MNPENNALDQEKKAADLNAILDNIKEVISGKSPNIEVLELTEKVEITVPDTKPNLDRQTEENRKAGLSNQEIASRSKNTVKDFIKFAEKREADPLAFHSGTTIEDIVVELIKPQLSDWLNKNLPSIVNNVVQKEIKKIIPQDE